MTKYYEYMDWGKYESDFPEIDKQPYPKRDDQRHAGNKGLHN